MSNEQRVLSQGDSTVDLFLNSTGQNHSLYHPPVYLSSKYITTLRYVCSALYTLFHT